MYKDVLLALSKDTTFRSSEPFPSPVSERRNPACGDEIALNGDLSGPSLTALRFHARGCAVSVASCAALCRELDGLSLTTARHHVSEALAFFESEETWRGDWGVETLPALGAVRARPMRMSCVRLPWEALRDSLGDA